MGAGEFEDPLYARTSRSIVNGRSEDGGSIGGGDVLSVTAGEGDVSGAAGGGNGADAGVGGGGAGADVDAGAGGVAGGTSPWALAEEARRRSAVATRELWAEIEVM